MIVTFWLCFVLFSGFLVYFLSCFFPCHVKSYSSHLFLFHSCTSSLITSPQYLVSRFPSLIADSSPYLSWSSHGFLKSCQVFASCYLIIVLFWFALFFTVKIFWYLAQLRLLFMPCLFALLWVLHLDPPSNTDISDSDRWTVGSLREYCMLNDCVWPEIWFRASMEWLGLCQKWFKGFYIHLVDNRL